MLSFPMHVKSNPNLQHLQRWSSCGATFTFDNSTPSTHTLFQKLIRSRHHTNYLFWIQNVDFCRMVTSLHPCIEVKVILMAYRRRKKYKKCFLEKDCLYHIQHFVHKMFLYALFLASACHKMHFVHIQQM